MFRALLAGRAKASGTVRLQLNQTCQSSSLNYWKELISRVGPQGRWFSGEGEGKGGGSGGSIKSAGGALGKREAAQEEQFFREKGAKEMKELKDVMKKTLKSKLTYHEMHVATHADGIRRHKEQLTKDHNSELHNFHIKQHEEAIRHEKSEISKIQEEWKRLRLDI